MTGYVLRCHRWTPQLCVEVVGGEGLVGYKDVEVGRAIRAAIRTIPYANRVYRVDRGEIDLPPSLGVVVRGGHRKVVIVSVRVAIYRP